jgi:restriction system protein
MAVLGQGLRGGSLYTAPVDPEDLPMKLPENSLFAILMRKDWWVSALCAVATYVLVQNFMPWGYALFATTPFTIITLMVIWKRIRVPSGARLERMLEKNPRPVVGGIRIEAGGRVQGRGFCRQAHQGRGGFRAGEPGLCDAGQCAALEVARTGVEPLKELVEYGERRDARQCRYVVAGELTEQARAYAKEQGVTLIEGAELVRLVRV